MGLTQQHALDILPRQGILDGPHCSSPCIIGCRTSGLTSSESCTWSPAFSLLPHTSPAMSLDARGSTSFEQAPRWFGTCHGPLASAVHSQIWAQCERGVPAIHRTPSLGRQAISF